jgi:Ca2+-binding RTX toxin-like protein
LGVGPDRLRGQHGDDREDGGPGEDVMFAGPGVDVVFGGEGDDRMYARALVDVEVSGADTMFAGDGNDIVFVRDGEADVVGCGPGRDRVSADSEDIVRDGCERVRIGVPGERPDRPDRPGGGETTR